MSSDTITARERLITLAYLGRADRHSARYHPVHAAWIYGRHGETIERVRLVVEEKARQAYRDTLSRIIKENRA